MTRLTNSPEGETTQDIAAYWVMRRMSGEMTDEERRSLEQWRSASPENAAAIAEYERMLLSIDTQAEEFLAAEFERELDAAGVARERSRLAATTRIAATLAAVAAAAIIAIFARPFSLPEPEERYATSIGEFRKVALDDGSEIELSSATRVKVAFSPQQRLLDLDSGEAFFQIDRDAARPFVVKSGPAEIIVTGTSFSVSRLGDASSVHVLTGVVDVKPLHGPSATLLAGDMIEVGPDGAAGVLKRYDPAVVLAWRSGKARFREQPLAEVVSALNRYFKEPIVIGDENIESLPVTGEFDIRDRKTTIRALALAFNLESREEPTRTVLTTRASQ